MRSHLSRAYVSPPLRSMGSTPILSWPRCPCGAGVWPLPSSLSEPCCARCLSLSHTSATLQATSRRNVLKTEATRVIEAYLCMAPGTYWHSIRRAHYVRWILCAKGSRFRKFTYSNGGMLGSVNETTDVIDVIIALAV